MIRHSMCYGKKQITFDEIFYNKAFDQNIKLSQQRDSKFF